MARLRERRISVVTGREPLGDADLVLLAVPDAAIPEVAQQVPIGPWVAHVSGATSLTALDPHERRFSVHPLQTLSLQRGPEQLDGAWAAITFETDDARAAAEWLAEHPWTPRLRRWPMPTSPSTTPAPPSPRTSW